MITTDSVGRPERNQILAYIEAHGAPPTDGSVTTAKIVDGAVTTAKLADANVTLAKIAPIAAGTILGNSGGSSASPSALSASTARTTLGLGTAATKDVATSGDASTSQVVKGDDSRLSDQRTPTDGSVTTAKIASGAVDLTTKVTGALPVANGGTGATTAGTARSNLGLGTVSTLDVDTDSTLAAGSDTRIPSQLAIKNFVINYLNGYSWKVPVVAISTTNVTLSGVASSGDFDGVTLSNNDRILVAGQTDAKTNGIYVYASGGAWSRATDADSSAELNQCTVMVSQGTTYADTQWTLTTNNPVLGSSNLVFQQFSGGGGSYSAGSGLALTGSTFSITAGGVTSSMLAANAVTTASITDAAVTTAKIADAAVTAAKLASTTVSAGSYTFGAFTVDSQGRLTAASNGAAFTGDSGSGGVIGLVPAPSSGDASAGKYLKSDGTWAVPPGSGGIADGSVTTAKLADSAVTTAKVNDGAVTNAKIANATIDLTAKVTGALPIANGGTGAINAATARSNLGIRRQEETNADLSVSGTGTDTISLSTAGNNTVQKINVTAAATRTFAIGTFAGSAGENGQLLEVTWCNKHTAAITLAWPSWASGSHILPISLPTSLGAGKSLIVSFRYNLADDAWDIVWLVQQ